MKKAILALLVLAMLLPCFCACKFMTISDEEAKQELEKLLPKAKELTDIFYGQGLPYESLPADSTDYYAFVKSDAPYQTVESLKAAAEKVFSKEYLAGVYEYAFEGSDYYASRYFTGKDSEGVRRLKINLKLQPMALLSEIDISSAKVIKGTPATAVVQVNAKSSTGKSLQKELTLVNENGVWLLDCAAY